MSNRQRESPALARRQFLKLGALFVPIVAAPTVAYSFLWADSAPPLPIEQAPETLRLLMRELALQLQIPERILWGRETVVAGARLSASALDASMARYASITGVNALVRP